MHAMQANAMRKQSDATERRADVGSVSQTFRQVESSQSQSEVETGKTAHYQKRFKVNNSGASEGEKNAVLTVGANVGSLLMFCYQDLWCFFPHHQIMIRTSQRQSELLFFSCS